MSTNLFAFLQAGARTITVNYQGYSNDYTYLTTDDSICVGDWAVICIDCAKTHKCVIVPLLPYKAEISARRCDGSPC